MEGIRLISHLGNGQLGTVFLAEHEGQELALKLQYGDDNEYLLNSRADREYGILEDLAEVQGVPSPIKRLDVTGSYDELGLEVAGKSLSKITKSNEPDIIFSGGFLFDYIPNVIHVEHGQYQKFNRRFSGKLSRLLDEIHESGYALGHDTDFVSSNGQPFILDVDSMKPATKLSVDTDNQRLRYAKARYPLLKRWF